MLRETNMPTNWGDDVMHIVCPSPWQLQRMPRPFPQLEIRRQVTNIDDFKFEDFIIHDYKPHPKIQMDMAVWDSSLVYS